MDTQLIITFAILVIALILFLTEKLPADLVALLVAVALGVSGVLTPQETFSGFSRSAVITIMAIFILTEALQRTGVAEQVGNILQKVGGRSELHLVIAVMVSGAFLSLFMNNIAAAAVLLPAASGAAKKAEVNTSRLLMPLAFGTILGGMATLLTTSNIVVNSILIDNKIEGFSLYDFAPVGIPMTIAGILYVAFIGRKSLPGESPLERTLAPNKEEQRDLIAAYHLGENLFRARVPEKSSLINKPLSDSHLREDFGVSVVAIERKDKKLFALSPETEIKRGDTLVLEGDEEDFRRRDVQPFMEFLPASEWHESDLESRAVEVVEAMLTPRSRLIGETLRSAHFREKYGMSVLAIWRGDQEIIADLADIPLAFGDALLLQGTREKLAVLSDDADLILLMSKEETAITVPNKGRAALIIFIATLALAVILPDLTAAVMLGGALAMMLTGILTTQQAYASISWKTVFLVAGMLPMGIALSKTNAAALLANGVVSSLGTFGALGLLAGLFIVTTLLVQAVSGAVVAAIIAPVAINVAQQTHTSPRTMAMGVALATSMAFMTPLGHAVNILVMSPGGYSFRDYVRIGTPLTIILFIVAMIFLPIFWSL
ncbi:MAG TPA: SLC13 family permease [Pyrinomonadaceae bacterium]|nr:SLC13 family permease [Pyrinomonadaceae bacterium]